MTGRVECQPPGSVRPWVTENETRGEQSTPKFRVDKSLKRCSGKARFFLLSFVCSIQCSWGWEFQQQALRLIPIYIFILNVSLLYPFHLFTRLGRKRLALFLMKKVWDLGYSSFKHPSLYHINLFNVVFRESYPLFCMRRFLHRASLIWRLRNVLE